MARPSGYVDSTTFSSSTSSTIEPTEFDVTIGSSPTWLEFDRFTLTPGSGLSVWKTVALNIGSGDTLNRITIEMRLTAHYSTEVVCQQPSLDVVGRLPGLQFQWAPDGEDAVLSARCTGGAAALAKVVRARIR